MENANKIKLLKIIAHTIDPYQVSPVPVLSLEQLLEVDIFQAPYRMQEFS